MRRFCSVFEFDSTMRIAPRHSQVIHFAAGRPLFPGLTRCSIGPYVFEFHTASLNGKGEGGGGVQQ